jgi:hypothetical protein
LALLLNPKLAFSVSMTRARALRTLATELGTPTEAAIMSLTSTSQRTVPPNQAERSSWDQRRALREVWRLRRRSQKMRAVAPMLRFVKCQSIGGVIRRAERREKVERRMAVG